MQRRAMQALSEYMLIKSGAARFADLGYTTDDGRPLEFKLLEFIAIDGMMAQATKDKSERGNH